MKAHVHETAIARRARSGDRVTSGSPSVALGRARPQLRGATLYKEYTRHGAIMRRCAWEKFTRKADYSRSAVYTECDDNARGVRSATETFANASLQSFDL